MKLKKLVELIEAIPTAEISVSMPKDAQGNEVGVIPTIYISLNQDTLGHTLHIDNISEEDEDIYMVYGIEHLFGTGGPTATSVFHESQEPVETFLLELVANYQQVQQEWAEYHANKDK